MGHKDITRLYTLDGKKTSAFFQLESLYSLSHFQAYNLFDEKTDVPAGLSSRMVWEMVHGRKRKTILTSHLNYIVQNFLADPKLNEPDSSQPNLPPNSNFSAHSLGQDDDAIELYKKDGRKSLALLKLERIYAGGAYGPENLLDGTTDPPSGLTSRMVWDMARTYKVRYIKKNHLEYLVKHFLAHDRLYGDNEWITLSPETRNHLVQERERSNISPSMLIKRATNCPKGLTAKIISDWIDQKTKTLQLNHLQFVIEEWKKYPDSPKFLKKRWLQELKQEFSYPA